MSLTIESYILAWTHSSYYCLNVSMSNHYTVKCMENDFNIIMEYMIGMEAFNEKGFKPMMGKN